MPKSQEEKDKDFQQKSINILVTSEMLEYIDGIGAPSRSEAVRDVVGSFVLAHRSGEREPARMANAAALRSTADRRRKVPGEDNVDWIKKVIWIPSIMHDHIEKICAKNVRVSDFIRGAISVASEEDPYPVEEEAEA